MPSVQLERLRALLGDEVFFATPSQATEEFPDEDAAPEAVLEASGSWTPQGKTSVVRPTDQDDLSSIGSCGGMIPLSEPWKKRKPRKKAPTKDTGKARDSTAGIESSLSHEDSREAFYCPIMAVAKFPYRFMTGSKADTELISAAYFAGGKFWERNWTIYFVHPSQAVAEKALLLVPASEVEAFLQDINDNTKMSIQFPSGSSGKGFKVSFPDDGSPQPELLGVTSSREAFQSLERQVPSESSTKGSWPLSRKGIDHRSFKAFKAKMEEAVAATKNKSKGVNESKRAQRMRQKARSCRQLKRAQRYLGLRPRVQGLTAENSFHRDATAEDDVKFLELEAQMAAFDLEPVRLDCPAPHPFDEEIIFVCVDIESWERSHSQVTEIGISTLDTRDLQGMLPGENGTRWMSKIRSRHFLIKERSHLVNKDFIIGCPDRFEFGETEVISLKDSCNILASCFRHPFSAVDGDAKPFATQTSLPYGQVTSHGIEKRKVVLLGHDTKSDIEYMRSLGFDAPALSSVVEIMDTADLHRAMMHEDQSTSLGNILCELAITGWNLHNAGNDATYTLQALIGISFRAFLVKDGLAGKHREKAEKLADEARVRAKEAFKEWNQADVVGDGGSPEKDLENYNPKSKRGGGK